jgi:hypothetical protein
LFAASLVRVPLKNDSLRTDHLNRLGGLFGGLPAGVTIVTDRDPHGSAGGQIALNEPAEVLCAAGDENVSAFSTGLDILCSFFKIFCGHIVLPPHQIRERQIRINGRIFTADVEIVEQ